MRQRVINYLNYLDEISNKEMSDEEKADLLKGFLIQLDFYQRERLIHLLVTLTFAIISIFSMIALTFVPNLAFTVFTLGMLIMLMFYVRHYFSLNAVFRKCIHIMTN